MAGILIAVTDHAAERYAQCVRGTLDSKAEVLARTSRAWQAGRIEAGERGRTLVRDVTARQSGGWPPAKRRRRGAMPPWVTLWEEGDDARVPRRFTDVLAILLALVVLLAAGCGDDRLSQDEYRAEAKTICSESRREAERIEQPTRATPEAIANFFRRQLEITERNVQRFAELKPPEDFQARHDRLVRLGRDGIAQVRSLVKRFEEGEDPQEVLAGAGGELQRIGEQQKEVARELDVPECAGG